MKKIILGIVTITAFNSGLIAQNVNIPDANFKAYLLGNTAINTDADMTEISVAEAEAFTGQIGCSNKGITDMTGLEAFVNITALQCIQNNLGTINISQNTSLTLLNVMVTSLNSLDISQNVNLTNLICNNNNLTTLDVSQNTSLEIIRCASNSITELDVSFNPNLYYLDCQANDLTVLNLKNINPSILTALNATTNPNLTCIEVDDVSAATSAWADIDPASSFSLDCTVYVSFINVVGAAGATLITTSGGTLQMEATVLPSNPDDGTYTWSLASGTGTGTIDASGLLTAISNGTVTVMATANDASGVTGTEVITISNQSSASLNENEISEFVEVYPNPVQTELFINSKEKIESIEIRNALGQIVKTISSNYNSIDVSDLKQGVYFIQIETSKGLVSKRFIKK